MLPFLEKEDLTLLLWRISATLRCVDVESRPSVPFATRLLIALLAVPHLALAACGTAPAASIPLTYYKNILTLPVVLNGSPEQFMLDTGAGITVVSNEAAGRLDIPHDFDHAAQVGGVGGANSVLFIGQIDTLQLDHIRFAHRSFPIIDLPERAASGVSLAGMLGADVLHQFDVDLDIPGGHVDLWKTSCPDSDPPWQHDAEPIQIDLDAENHILVPFKVDGVAMTGVLDTGASSFPMTTRAALRAGVTQDDLDNDVPVHGTGVNNRSWTGHFHRFAKVVFGGAVFTHMPTAIIPSTGINDYDGLIGADALLGLPMLARTRIWISYRARELFIVSTAHPSSE